MEGVTDPSEQNIETPFGSPSDAIIGGKLAGRQVYFLPRHGRGHRILPHELNHRANIYALRSLNVRWIICVTAVGSLQEKYAPRDVLLPSQFFDRTSQRSGHTFFGEGIAAHISFADPISTEVAQSARGSGARIESAGAQWRHLCEHGWPGFFHARRIGTQSRNGFDVIGMTNLPEAKLAREAEIALASMAMITDYDCWKVEEEPVSAEAVFGHLMANAERQRKSWRR